MLSMSLPIQKWTDQGMRAHRSVTTAGPNLSHRSRWSRPPTRIHWSSRQPWSCQERLPYRRRDPVGARPRAGFRSTRRSRRSSCRRHPGSGKARRRWPTGRSCTSREDRPRWRVTRLDHLRGHPTPHTWRGHSPNIRRLSLAELPGRRFHRPSADSSACRETAQPLFRYQNDPSKGGTPVPPPMTLRSGRRSIRPRATRSASGRTAHPSSRHQVYFPCLPPGGPVHPSDPPAASAVSSRRMPLLAGYRTGSGVMARNDDLLGAATTVVIRCGDRGEIDAREG